MKIFLKIFFLLSLTATVLFPKFNDHQEKIQDNLTVSYLGELLQENKKTAALLVALTSVGITSYVYQNEICRYLIVCYKDRMKLRAFNIIKKDFYRDAINVLGENDFFDQKYSCDFNVNLVDLAKNIISNFKS